MRKIAIVLRISCWIEKRIYFLALLTVILVSAAFFLWQKDERDTKSVSLDQFVEGDIAEITYCLESIENLKDAQVMLNGWFVVNGKEYSFYNYGLDQTNEAVYNDIYLAYIDGDTVYELPTKLYEREDVNELLTDEIDYEYCGFKTYVEDLDKVETYDLAIITTDPSGLQTLYRISWDDMDTKEYD